METNRNQIPEKVHRAFASAFLAVLVACGPPCVGWSSEPNSVEFFETKIRPVLIERCYECHSQEADEIGGSLWLDSADAMKLGGDSGPAVFPGDASASVLISAIKYESSEMPPDQPLPPSVVDDFVRWIEAGAIDPRKKGNKSTPNQKPGDSQIDLEAGREFWAFQPIKDFRRTLKEPLRTNVDVQFVDYLIDQKTEEAELRQARDAFPATRLRRLAFDLTGLPPTPELLDQWLAEPTDQKWQSIVDAMLDSRDFAKHWARHWLDISRYADSNGSDFNATFHDAWRYRDYVVDSFHSNRPMDEMIRQQVAGDLLDAESDQQRYDNLVATTFLMLGPKMLSERNKAKLALDVADEQIDTIGRAFLGMTLGCARCHDHKFDPIPTEDYYALAGIFKSTQTLNGESQKYVSDWNRTPLPTTLAQRQAVKEHKAALASLKKKLDAASRKLKAAKRAKPAGIVVDDVDAVKTGHWVASTYSKGFIGDGYSHDDNTEKGSKSIEYRTRLPRSGRYEVRLSYSANGNRADKMPVTVVAANETFESFVNQRKSGKEAPWKTLGTFEFSKDQDAVVTLRNEGTSGYVIADAVQFLSKDSKPKKPVEPSAHSQVIAELQAVVDSLNANLKELKKNAPPALPLAMSPADFSTDLIADSPVHIRGEERNLGPVVPRGFLQVCGSGDASIGTPSGSGRLELARWLTDPDNPLVARVLANRIWLHLFGEGIVRTPDNFGSRGERPTHPELLDALAIDLMREGWRPKTLIRKLVLSKAYRRSTEYDAASAAIDPENRLLWRANRKRISAESIRDSMLTAAGILSDDEPEAPVAHLGTLVSKNNGDSKVASLGDSRPVRTMYLPIIRGNISPFLTTMDAANPDLLVGKRSTTNVPSQALVLLNSDDVNQWAALTAKRIVSTYQTWPERVSAVYRYCLARTPSERDLDLASHYLGIQEISENDVDSSVDEQRLGDFVSAIFASTEFRLLD